MRMRLFTCFGLCAVFLLAYVSCENEPQAAAETEYTVSFRTGSGGTPIADKKVREGITLDLELSEYQPERRGYSFEGWSVTNTTTLIAEITVTENISLTAQWTPNVSVTLNMRGGTLDVDDPGADISPGDFFEAEWYTPSLRGFVFLYWHLENDPRQEEVKRIQVYDNITLAAKWEAGWVVTFDLGDDEATLFEGGYITVAKNSTLDLTTIRPVRDNYVLSGWYRNGDFTDSVPAGLRVTGNITLYAKWEHLNFFEPLFGVWTGSAGTYLLYHDPHGSGLLSENGLIGFYFSEDEICSFVWTAEKINGKPWNFASDTLTVGEGASANTFTASSYTRWPQGNEAMSKLWVKGKDDDIVLLNLFETGNGTLEANGRSFWLSYVLSGATLYLLRHDTDEFDDHLPGEVLLAIPAIEGVLSGFEEKVFDGEGEGEGVL